MNTVINLREFKEWGRPTPTLVLMDLHDHKSTRRAGQSAGESGALVNCRLALRHARTHGFPVAFTRYVTPPVKISESPTYPNWIKGFEPLRSDMIFDRQRPSCYASKEFADMVGYIGGNYVIAGQFGELSCLATAVDAHHHDHRITVLCDALISCAAQGDPAAHEAMTRIIAFYAETLRTQSWILAPSRGVRVRE